MRRNRITILNILFGGTVILFIIFSAMTIKEYNQYRTVKREAAKLSAAVWNQKNGKDFDKLKKINPNIVAWIKIKGTDIDYPVVMAEDNSYYLSHDIYNKGNKYGALFTDYRLKNPFETDLQNCIVYGHNMGRNAAVMFSELKKYEDKAFYQTHDTVKIFTVQRPEGENYRILAVRRVGAASNSFTLEFSDKQDFRSWLDRQCKNSIYPCSKLTGDITKSVTLSTCTNDGKNRFIIVCGKESGSRISRL